MKFLSISGPRDDIDRVVDQYLSKYEIHLENALSELKNVQNLRPFTETNPYRAECQRAKELISGFSEKEGAVPSPSMDVKEAAETIHRLDQLLGGLLDKEDSLKSHLRDARDFLDQIRPFVGLDYNIHQIFQFKYVKYRFGRMAKDYYNKFYTFVYDYVHLPRR